MARYPTGPRWPLTVHYVVGEGGDQLAVGVLSQAGHGPPVVGTGQLQQRVSGHHCLGEELLRERGSEVGREMGGER